MSALGTKSFFCYTTLNLSMVKMLIICIRIFFSNGNRYLYIKEVN